MSNVLITFTTDYYPSNTGFAQAFLHLHKSIINGNACDHVYVFTEGEHLSPDLENITVYNLPKVRGMHYLSYDLTRKLFTNHLKKEYQNIISTIYAISRENNVQLILIESMFMAWIIPILKKEFQDIAIVCRIHGTGPEYTAFYRQLEDIKYRDYLLNCVFESDNICATTKFYFDFFRDYYRDYNRFIDREFFILPNTTVFDEIESIGKENNRFYLLQLGRMDMRGYHQKGFQDTVKALMYIEEIAPELASKIVFTTVGTGNREKAFLERTAHFKYITHIHHSKLDNSNVKQLELQADIVLLPSRCEGMSMFATEALAAGKPIIGTKGNGLEALCKDGYNSYLLSEYDYIRMAEAIMNLCLSDGLLIKMSNNSKDYYNNNCSYDAVVAKYNLMVRYLTGNETK